MFSYWFPFALSKKVIFLNISVAHKCTNISVRFESNRCCKGIKFLSQLKLSNTDIFTIRWCKPLIFQTYIIWSNIIHSFKYKRSTTFGSKDIEIRKVVTKTQFLRITHSYAPYFLLIVSHILLGQNFNFVINHLSISFVL